MAMTWKMPGLWQLIDWPKIVTELEVTSDEMIINIVTVDVAKYAQSHFVTPDQD